MSSNNDLSPQCHSFICSTLCFLKRKKSKTDGSRYAKEMRKSQNFRPKDMLKVPATADVMTA